MLAKSLHQIVQIEFKIAICSASEGGTATSPTDNADTPLGQLVGSPSQQLDLPLLSSQQGAAIGIASPICRGQSKRPLPFLPDFSSFSRFFPSFSHFSPSLTQFFLIFGKFFAVRVHSPPLETQ